MGPSTFGAMGLMPAMPVRCSSAGFTGGSRLLPNCDVDDPPWFVSTVGRGAGAAAAIGWNDGECDPLLPGMMRAGGDCGLVYGDPCKLDVLARCMLEMGGDGAAMLGVVYGLGEWVRLEVES